MAQVGGAVDIPVSFVEATQGRRASHGQQALRRGNLAMSILLGHAQFPTKIATTIHKKGVNDLWVRGIEAIEARLEGSIPRGQSTLLLDELEANYSLVWQARLWRLLAKPELAEKFQIIVATHSAFALGIKHANYIEVAPGFVEEVESALRARYAIA